MATRQITTPRPSLTPRQVEVVRLMAQGRRYSEIASELGLSPLTVRSYVERIYGRLGVYSRAGAVGLALRELLD